MRSAVQRIILQKPGKTGILHIDSEIAVPVGSRVQPSHPCKTGIPRSAQQLLPKLPEILRSCHKLAFIDFIPVNSLRLVLALWHRLTGSYQISLRLWRCSRKISGHGSRNRPLAHAVVKLPADPKHSRHILRLHSRHGVHHGSALPDSDPVFRVIHGMPGAQHGLKRGNSQTVQLKGLIVRTDHAVLKLGKRRKIIRPLRIQPPVPSSLQGIGKGKDQFLLLGKRRKPLVQKLLHGFPVRALPEHRDTGYLECVSVWNIRIIQVSLSP